MISLKKNWKMLLLSLAVPLAVGGAASFLTRDSMEVFEKLDKPPLAPPGWVFPIVWTVLFLMMGYASYLVMSSQAHPKRIERAMKLYAAQLVMNFFWTIIFFKLGWYFAAFLWLLVFWLLIAATAGMFYRIKKAAGYLLLPYLLWVAFAGYLNCGVYLLN